MRVDCSKKLFVGVAAEKETFFREAQERGCIEFIDSTDTKMRETPPQIQRTMQAIKVLRGLPPVEQEETTDWDQADGIVDTVLDYAAQLESLQEEQRLLRQEIARIAVFGDFSLEEMKALEAESGRRVQFFAAKQSVVHDLPDHPDLVYVNSEHGLDYFISFGRQERNYEGMIEMRIDQPLGVLERRATEVERGIESADGHLSELAKYNHFLHQALVQKLDEHSLDTAQSFVEYGVNAHIFAVQGWVPLDKAAQLDEIVQRCRVHVEDVAIEDADRLPTALSNTGLARVGEDLVHIYDTPGTGDKDPSIWVLCAFAVFFAVILSDGGYGLLFALLAAFLYIKFPNLQGAGKRVRTLTTILAGSCIVWGVLTNSFFGMQFGIDSPARSFSLVQYLAEKKAAYHMAQKDDVYVDWLAKFPQVQRAESGYDFLELASTMDARGKKSYVALDKFSDNIMLEFALLIGVVHIALSFLRSVAKSWAGLGWIAFMIGAYLNFPSILNATSMTHFLLGVDKTAGAEAGLELLYGGMGSALLLAIIQNKGAGVLEIMNLIQVFADVLSYLRLYALGLAGAMMSATFNQIGAEVSFVAGMLIILIGHTVNIVLSIMGGVIHGLRLNFLEWYHYSFEGGGKLFNPLRRLSAE